MVASCLMIVGCSIDGGWLLGDLGCARSLRERDGASERILERGGESMKEIYQKGSRENESIKEIIKNIEE